LLAFNCATIDAWLSDDEHSITMLSEFRSDIGAGVSMSRDDWGQDQIYVVIETALQTLSWQQPSGERDFLTHLPDIISGTNSINGTPIPFSIGKYIIPVVQSTARPDGDVFHQVQYGQTLWSMAITYGTTIEQIRRLNNLGTSNIVYEQQMLLVKKGATQPMPVPTQTATIVFSKSSPLTPSPIAAVTEVAAGIATQRTYQSSSVVLVIIIGLSLALAGVVASLRVKTPR
jgi:Predicted glycosyl hydrolase